MNTATTTTTTIEISNRFSNEVKMLAREAADEYCARVNIKSTDGHFETLWSAAIRDAQFGAMDKGINVYIGEQKVEGQRRRKMDDPSEHLYTINYHAGTVVKQFVEAGLRGCSAANPIN